MECNKMILLYVVLDHIDNSIGKQMENRIQSVTVYLLSFLFSLAYKYKKKFTYKATLRFSSS